MTTMEISISQEEQEAANQIACKNGFTLDEIFQNLVQRILRDNCVPTEFLDALRANNEEKKIAHKKAFESIEQWPKYIIGTPLTIEEIISARDEGRK